MEQLYKFNLRDYNTDGTNLKDGQFFLDVIGTWEKDFHDRYYPFCSTHLLANASSMLLIKQSFAFNQNEDCGMDLIGGEIDLDKNLEMEKHSSRTTIYAIGSKLDEDEPVFLVRDDTMEDGMILLKYIPDSDDREEVSPEVPVESNTVKTNR